VAVQPTDMRREEDIRRLFAIARERFGGVDILVNNAGLGRAAPLGSAPTELWREMLEVNVLGLAIATREAIQDMERRGAAGRDVAEAIVWVVTRPPHVEVHDLLVRPTAQKN